MVNESERSEDGAALWAKAKHAFGPAESGQVPDDVTIAAYLEGRLDSTAAARIEAWLTASEAGLDLVAAARTSLAAPVKEAPDRAVQRAQALVGFAPRQSTRGLFGWLSDLVPPAWHPAHALGVICVLVLLGAGSFELGREGAMAFAEPQQTVEEDLASSGVWPSDSFL